MKLDAIQVVNQLIDAFRSVQEAYQQAERDEEFCDQEYNDLTHGLELIDFNAAEGFKLAKQLKENRTKRRAAKDTIEQLRPLYVHINRNKPFIDGLKNIHAEIETTKNVQMNRVYRPRVRADLFDQLKKAKGR